MVDETTQSGGALPPAAEGPTGRTPVVQFLRECVAELRRVQWPGRDALWQASMVVIAVCAIVGFYIYVLDAAFSSAASWLVDQQVG